MAHELVVMQCPVAGFQFHAGELCWTQMRPSDPLTLRREPGNRHDARAVRVEWQGRMLGYLPRESNFAVSQMIDRGVGIEARIIDLRTGKDPWSRVMVEVVARERELPQRLPKERKNELLIRSLANRIFGTPVPDAELKWTADHVELLALAGVEHPALLPFFRMIPTTQGFAAGADAVSMLRGLMEAHQLEASAWKRLEKWGYAPFQQFAVEGCEPDPYHVTALANLLFRLDVQAPPPPLFCKLAGATAAWKYGEFDPMVFESFPDWFMRALLRECEAAKTDVHALRLETELATALDWGMETNPQPDANQRHAGWTWIMEAANAYEAKLLARPWKVPIAETLYGEYRVVPIENVAELRQEAQVMSNCLCDYEDACAAGTFVVFSIRLRATGKRVACFAASKRAEKGKGMWNLVQVVGKSNSAVSKEIEGIAAAVVAKL